MIRPFFWMADLSVLSNHHERVLVRLEVHDEAGGEHLARTGTVLHDHGLAENISVMTGAISAR